MVYREVEGLKLGREVVEELEDLELSWNLANEVDSNFDMWEARGGWDYNDKTTELFG